MLLTFLFLTTVFLAYANGAKAEKSDGGRIGGHPARQSLDDEMAGEMGAENLSAEESMARAVAARTDYDECLACQ